MDPITPPPAPGAYVPGTTPGVIIWNRVYLILLALLYLLLVGVGVVFFLELLPVTEEDLDGVPQKVMGVIYFVLGLAFFIPFVIGLFLPRKPWVWVYLLVLICLGMTSCTIVASIPLLIFWLKPDVKGYFGRQA